MTKNNDRYTGMIPANCILLYGLEYYIVASDGINNVYCGTPEQPYQVEVQETVDASSLGDVNNDGHITTVDALMVLQAINDKINLTNDQFLRADINSDGELSAAEALRILMYVNGKITTIKYEEDLEGSKDIYNAPLISTNNNYYASIVNGGDTMYYMFIPTTSGLYSFYSTGNNGDTYCHLYDANQNEIATDDDGYGEFNNFKLDYYLETGQIYYVAVRFLSTSTTGTIPFTVSQIG
jgi:hypothetical protein